MILFIFGDSITFGYWDEEGGWADRIKRSALARDVRENLIYYHGVHNLGIDGNMTKDIVARFENEVEARLWPDSKYGFVFATGTNDTLHHGGKGFVSSPEEYQQHLQRLLEMAAMYTTNITFVNLLPVNEQLTNPLESSRSGKCYTNERIDLFNQKLNKFCSENGLKLIDVYAQFSGKEKELHADGIHPNSKGHEIIYDAVWPVVSSWLYQK